MNIKNDEVERLIVELAAHTGETRTEAVRKAVLERLERTRARAYQRQRQEAVMAWLRADVWPLLPPVEAGRPLTREEEAEILGYGPEGV